MSWWSWSDGPSSPSPACADIDAGPARAVVPAHPRDVDVRGPLDRDRVVVADGELAGGRWRFGPRTPARGRCAQLAAQPRGRHTDGRIAADATGFAAA